MLRLYKNQERITMDGRKFYRNLIDSMERNHYNFFRTDQSVGKENAGGHHMLSRYSVKKPYTVVVAVILVLILGAVSFTKMNTDLLPSMDMPYAVVMTTYPGASPETVEQTVTRPIEQSMACLLYTSPLYKGNVAEITAFAKEIKEKYPKKTIWLYTGYLWEEIQDLELLPYLDVIVDGKFILEQRDVSLKWKGSANQRVIDVKKSLETGSVVLHA